MNVKSDKCYAGKNSVSHTILRAWRWNADFQLTSRWGHPIGIASAAVTLWHNADRLLIITVRDLSFFIVSDLQDNFGTLYGDNLPIKKIKINKLVVKALYQDELILFTDLWRRYRAMRTCLHVTISAIFKSKLHLTPKGFWCQST